ncbi:hypothetical protein EG328_003638 [Venturia inaequalis]|uniref:E3 ubiquitin-protein ligase n=1 Tax=Venturia inaequalis TaxID=5025 RepID=A0A8H3VHU9_VENIN|nr:hypothetical protein EG328_003638 [Venturia inaequalis]RDI86274.1 hypothetical protein Vi05172_g3786 [Venturia inaequalis]
MAPEDILLEGAPDSLIGNSDAWKSNPVQVMQLEMSNDVLDDLLDCVRRNKSPQVIFGRNPKLQYDGKSLNLQAFEEKVGTSGSHELYKVDDEGVENKWSFAGIINYNLVTIQKVEEASAGADKAMEQLRNTQALAKQEIEARKPTVSTPEMRAAQGRKGLSKAQARASLLNPLSGRSSPALGASTPSNLPAPTSAGLDSNMPMAIAGKKVLIHLLAVKPQTYETCRKLLHFNCRDILEKAGKKNEAGEWTLIDRTYKELDVWNFKYQKDEDREAAIQGAIRAYDRLRLSKEDKLWQMLLPQEERGKGVVLSRLNIKNVADTAATTPATKATTYNKKTGLPKKTVERKKPADKDAAKAKKAKDGEVESAKKAPAPKPRTTKDAAAKERLAAKRKERASKDEDRTPAPKKARPSTAAKSLLNKPKNPSPLSASPPVNASDFEDGHPVHKALSAITSPKRAEKRKAIEMNGDGPLRRSTPQINGVTNNNKRQHLDSSSNSSISPSSSQSQQLTHPPTTTNKPTNGLTNGYPRAQQTKHEHSGHHSPETSDSSQERSPPMKLSWKQSLDLAKRFKTYYDKYKLLHEELAGSDLPPSEKKRMELISMRDTLERMKRQVREGVL